MNILPDESGLPEVAWSYIEKLRNKCYDFKTAPIRGQKRDDLRENIRISAFDKNAVVAFEVNVMKRNKMSLSSIFFMAVEIMKPLCVTVRTFK